MLIPQLKYSKNPCVSLGSSGKRACHGRPRREGRVEKHKRAAGRCVRWCLHSWVTGISEKSTCWTRPRCCHTLTNTQFSPSYIKPLQPLPQALSTCVHHKRLIECSSVSSLTVNSQLPATSCHITIVRSSGQGQIK